MRTNYDLIHNADKPELAVMLAQLVFDEDDWEDHASEIYDWLCEEIEYCKE